jgi:thiol:disulfide interchange protein DsbG
MRTRSLLVTLVAICIVIIVIVAIVFQYQKRSLSNSPQGKLVQKLMSDKVTVVKTFEVKGLSKYLTGMVLQLKDGEKQKSIAFTDPKANVLFDGTLLSKTGENLTLKYAKEYLYDKATLESMKPTHKIDDSVWDKLQKTHKIFQGDKNTKKQLIAILDPNCPFCHEEFLDLQPYIKEKKIAVHWLVVGMLKPSSTEKAQAILSSKNPFAALTYNETHFDMDAENGGVTKDKYPINKQGIAAAKANLDFFIGQEFMMAPLIIYKNKKGETMLHKGYADKKQLKELINNIQG